MDINTHHTIFSLFYTLYSAMAIAIAGKTQPFDTPSMFKGYIKAWGRFIFSFFILNIIPLLSFAFVFNLLGRYSKLELSFYSAILVFLPSLVGLGFYRIHYGFMLLKGNKGYVFYDKALYEKKTKYLPPSLHNDLESRPKFHEEPSTHIIPGFIWILIAMLPVLCLFVIPS
ncbi:MAG: hypothetical protein HS100_10800 [Anaerolineales bacterium]|nr:hypothetical protein [Anaerolineales bacterium]